MFRIIMLYALLLQSLYAQDVPIVASSVQITIPAKTPLVLEFTAEVSSKTAVVGSSVQLLLAENLVVNEKVVIPKGTLAVGEVIHAQKSGFGGKGGELVLAARYLLFNEQRIKLRSLRPIAGIYVGKNNTDASFALGAAAAVTIPIVGFAAVFITGGEIKIPTSTRATALIAVDTAIDVAVVGP